MVMIQETLLQIKKKVENTESVGENNKKELMDLLTLLGSEIEQLSTTDQDRAESILGFASASAHEATRKNRNPNLQKMSLEGLQASVHGFESSHPKLVEIVNSISTALSNLGI
jgi:malonyl CoA-acyl carrier protein transacylase